MCVDVCSTAGAVEGSRAVCRVCVCGRVCLDVQHGRCSGGLWGSMEGVCVCTCICASGCVQHGRCGGRLWGSMEGVCVYVDGGSMAGAVEGSGAVCRVCVCVCICTHVRGCVRHGRCGGGLWGSFGGSVCAWMCAAQQVVCRLLEVAGRRPAVLPQRQEAGRDCLAWC